LAAPENKTPVLQAPTAQVAGSKAAAPPEQLVSSAETAGAAADAGSTPSTAAAAERPMQKGIVTARGSDANRDFKAALSRPLQRRTAAGPKPVRIICDTFDEYRIPALL